VIESDSLASITFLAIALGVAATLFFVLHFAFSSGDDQQARKRVQKVHGRWIAVANPKEAAIEASLRRAGRGANFSTLDALGRRFIARPSILRDRLAQAGLRASIGEYIAVTLVVTILFSLAYMTYLNATLAILVGLAKGIALPHYVLGVLIRRRAKRFLARFADAIDLIVRGLRSGLPITESIRTVGQEFEGPVAEEFRQVADQIQLGEQLESALWEAVRRMDLPDFKFFVVSLSVQRETGGNLAETLDNLSDILRRRRQMLLKVRAMSSEARTSAIILGSLPFVMFGILSFVNYDYVMELFNDPRGRILVGLGLGSLGTGVAIMVKMVRFEI